ncbi:MAG: DUF4258 domain-containing protein [Phycisphaeraceae bacterium]|nr:DUF4258 domain-containing protein [Phycisphaeraceae bacterium]
MKSQEAIRIIRQCISTERYRLLRHFSERMDERGVFWPDIQAVIDHPKSVRDAGVDQYDRPRWLVAGKTTDLLNLEMVVVIDHDDDGNLVLLITIYYED